MNNKTERIQKKFIRFLSDGGNIEEFIEENNLDGIMRKQLEEIARAFNKKESFMKEEIIDEEE